MIYDVIIKPGKSSILKNEHFEFKFFSKIYGTGYYKYAPAKKLQDKVLLSEPDKTELKGKSFYRYPNLCLPRDKMNLVKDSLGIKITRKIENADYIIVPKDLVLNVLNVQWLYTITLERFKDLILANEDFGKDCKTILSKRLDDIKNQHQETVRFKFYTDGCYNLSFMNVLKDEHKGNYYLLLDPKNKDLLDRALNNNNVVSDSYMNDICSSELHVFTEDEIDTIIDMIKTQKVDNVSLALEMMSNCNMKKCYTFLAYICFFYFNVLKDLSNNWNSINVKTLRKVMDNYLRDHHELYLDSYSMFLRNLLDDNALTEWVYEKTLRRAYDKTMKRVGFNEGFFQVDMESIYMSDELKAKMI